MSRGIKRIANVPRAADLLDVSKADLLEAAWGLASLCNDGDGCDDDAATLRRLIEELNALRTARGGRPVQTFDMSKPPGDRRVDAATFHGAKVPQ